MKDGKFILHTFNRTINTYILNFQMYKSLSKTTFSISFYDYLISIFYRIIIKNKSNIYIFGFTFHVTCYLYNVTPCRKLYFKPVFLTCILYGYHTFKSILICLSILSSACIFFSSIWVSKEYDSLSVTYILLKQTWFFLLKWPQYKTTWPKIRCIHLRFYYLRQCINNKREDI